MYFTNPTVATAVAIVAMTFSHSALISVAAAPVTLSQADYLNNGHDAQTLNKAFQNVTVQDPCNGTREPPARAG
jgi:NhaP-type Na+/H+ or K+/H+ antiporter